MNINRRGSDYGFSSRNSFSSLGEEYDEDEDIEDPKPKPNVSIIEEEDEENKNDPYMIEMANINDDSKLLKSHLNDSHDLSKIISDLPDRSINRDENPEEEKESNINTISKKRVNGDSSKKSKKKLKKKKSSKNLESGQIFLGAPISDIQYVKPQPKDFQ